MSKWLVDIHGELDGDYELICRIENVISLDKVKKAREKIRKLDDINPDYPMDRTIHVNRNEVLEILDELIAESEGK